MGHKKQSTGTHFVKKVQVNQFMDKKYFRLILSKSQERLSKIVLTDRKIKLCNQVLQLGFPYQMFFFRKKGRIEFLLKSE